MKAQNRKNYVRFNDQLGVNAVDETLLLDNSQVEGNQANVHFPPMVSLSLSVQNLQRRILNRLLNIGIIL